MEEEARHADCSADNCHLLSEATSCDVEPALECYGRCDHEFTAEDGNSGSSYSAMAWVNCE
jgi:hypothetical protein